MGMPIYGHAPNIPKIDAYQIWSYHISIESKFNADQQCQKNLGSKINQIRVLTIYRHAHIWACPPKSPKLMITKYGQIIYQSKANFMLISNANRTQDRKSTRTKFCPYLDHEGLAPLNPQNQIGSHYISIESEFHTTQLCRLNLGQKISQIRAILRFNMPIFGPFTYYYHYHYIHRTDKN